jgi:hypothetical protein
MLVTPNAPRAAPISAHLLNSRSFIESLYVYGKVSEHKPLKPEMINTSLPLIWSIFDHLFGEKPSGTFLSSASRHFATKSG